MRSHFAKPCRVTSLNHAESLRQTVRSHFAKPCGVTSQNCASHFAKPCGVTSPNRAESLRQTVRSHFAKPCGLIANICCSTEVFIWTFYLNSTWLWGTKTEKVLRINWIRLPCWLKNSAGGIVQIAITFNSMFCTFVTSHYCVLNPSPRNLELYFDRFHKQIILSATGY